MDIEKKKEEFMAKYSLSVDEEMTAILKLFDKSWDDIEARIAIAAHKAKLKMIWNDIEALIEEVKKEEVHEVIKYYANDYEIGFEAGYKRGTERDVFDFQSMVRDRILGVTLFKQNTREYNEAHNASKEALKPEYQECTICHLKKPDVSTRINPYIRDVGNEEVWETVCDDCEEQQALDI